MSRLAASHSSDVVCLQQNHDATDGSFGVCIADGCDRLKATNLPIITPISLLYWKWVRRLIKAFIVGKDYAASATNRVRILGDFDASCFVHMCF